MTAIYLSHIKLGAMKKSGLFAFGTDGMIQTIFYRILNVMH